MQDWNLHMLCWSKNLNQKKKKKGAEGGHVIWLFNFLNKVCVKQQVFFFFFYTVISEQTKLKRFLMKKKQTFKQEGEGFSLVVFFNSLVSAIKKKKSFPFC